jgi:hypothetical protein
MTIEIETDLGQPISYETLTKGLKELCPGLHFDMAGALGMWHPLIGFRAGVFYEGAHVCSIDRGMVPEYKLWSMKEQLVPIPISEAAASGLPIQWAEILPEHELYLYGLELARSGKDDNWIWDAEKERLIRRQAFKLGQARDRVMKVGWRHTFEALLNARLKIGRDLPGITRDSLAHKFGVDMGKFPQGAPQEVVAALFEE